MSVHWGYVGLAYGLASIVFIMMSVQVRRNFQQAKARFKDAPTS